MMRVLASLAAGLAAATVVGCGVSTTEQAYTSALIKQVGAGSVAEAQLIPTFQSLKAVGGFSDPRTQQAMLYLFQGQLAKLTVDDLVKMAKENQTAAKHIGGVLTRLDRLANSLTCASVDASSFQSLPDGSKTFIADWNGYLTSTARAIRTVRQALTGINPVYNETQRLLRAAYDTARTRSTAQFDKVRASVFKDIAPRYARLQRATQTLGAQGVEQKLVSYVNGNQEAQAIVTKVNQQYPNGFLAQEFRRS